VRDSEIMRAEERSVGWAMTKSEKEYSSRERVPTNNKSVLEPGKKLPRATLFWSETVSITCTRY